jgi:hypothetical protein
MTQKFDSAAPGKLKKTQLWFAGIITQRIDEDSRIPPCAPSGTPIEEEACIFIKPSPTLRPAQRIELYSQQYWWRLLSILHDTYPFVTRLFGHHDFNQTLGIPYLMAYPPNTWSLNALGNNLPQWIFDNYHNSDKKLVQNAAELDFGFHDCFVAPQLKPLQSEATSQLEDFSPLLTRTLYLQPSVALFQFDYDLLNFRMEFLKEPPEYWIDNNFPPLEPTPLSLVVFRNSNNHTVWNTLTEAEIKLLNCFRKGSTIEEACNWIEQQDKSIYEEAEKNLHLWIQSWIVKKWLTLERPN